MLIHALMTANVSAMVPALCQTCLKYVADLGTSAKTNLTSAIALFVSMSLYAGISLPAGLRSKSHSFSAALGCGAYLLAPIGVVTSMTSRRAAGMGCLKAV